MNMKYLEKRCDRNTESMEDSTEFSQKVQTELLYDSAKQLLGVYMFP